MNILFSSQCYEPAWAYGGGPRLVSDIARHLAKHHKVTVLTTDVLDKGQRIDIPEETLGNVHVIRYPTISNFMAWHLKIIISRKFTHEVERYVCSNDFVYLADLRHWQNAVILRYLFKYKKPYSVAAHGQIRIPFDWKSPIKALYDRVWGVRMIRHAGFLVAQTRHEADDYLRYGAREEQIHLMPLSADPPRDDEWGEKKLFRNKYNIDSDTRLLLFVGRIHKLKGLDLLLKSFALTKRRLSNKDIRLIIVGMDDGYLSKLNAQIRQLNLTNFVILTGALYGKDNAACYLDSDLFVITPTYYEETTLASVRALSFGLPVLTVPQAELPWLDDYRAGITSECKPEAIADKLTMLLKNDTILREMRHNAIQLFNEHYTPKKTIDILEHAIQRAVQTLWALK